MEIDRHRNSKARQARRREEAIARQEAAALLSPQEKLARLDLVFGVGKGATKERFKLQERIRTGGAKQVTLAQAAIEIEDHTEAERTRKPRRRQRHEKRGN